MSNENFLKLQNNLGQIKNDIERYEGQARFLNDDLRKLEKEAQKFALLTFFITGVSALFLYQVKRYHLVPSIILSTLFAGIFIFLFAPSSIYYSREMRIYLALSSILVTLYAYIKAFKDFRPPEKPLRDDGF